MNTKNLLLLVLLCLSQLVWAQVPQKMSYQAVIRNGEGKLIANQEISLKVSIVKSDENGELVFEETHLSQTNSNGLISIQIGGGEGSYSFSSINWADDIYFIKTETDPDGGTNYTLTSVNQILSVPYAMAAKTAETLSTPIEEQDPHFNAWDKNYEDLTNTPVTITEAQAQAITANSAKNSYPTADANKLNSIETGADENVQADWNATEGDAMILNKPNIPDTKDMATQSALEDTASAIRLEMFSGSYNDLSQKPTTITQAQAQAITVNSAKNTYPTADANKLNGIEIGAEANVQADWNATSGDAQILNKPNLSNTVQVSSPAQGDLAYYDGLQWQRIAKGTNGQVLKMDNNTPAWNDESQSNTGLPTPNAENEGQFLMSNGENYVASSVMENSISKLYIYNNVGVRGGFSAANNNISLSQTGFHTDVDAYFMSENYFHGNINLKKDKIFYFGTPDTDGTWKIVVEDDPASDKSSKLVFYVHLLGTYFKVKEFQYVIN